jgi:5'-nucleotidase
MHTVVQQQVSMAYSIENKLVVGITSTALFDCSLEHQVYEQEGVEAFKRYQEANRTKLPEPGRIRNR